jgi:predicted alpha-1,6-mannanase (GH76 family)
VNAETATPTATWAARAARAHEALITKYWNPEVDLFDTRFPLGAVTPDEPFHYWWQAHALDTLVDAFERDGDRAHLERASRLLRGLRNRNSTDPIHGGEGITNAYYDDMQWLALACLRAYDASGEASFKDTTLELWRDIQTGWNDTCGGGIAWKKDMPFYKNTPANAPAAILAARLHARFGHDRDLEWAKRIFHWLEAHLIDPDTGFVWDGTNRLQDGRTDKDWAFTYCQGVTIGAAVELHVVTDEVCYLERAAITVRAARDRLGDPVTHVLPDEGSGDAGLFKGILVRYLERYTRLTGDADARAWLEANALLAWKNHDAQTGLIGRDWTQTPEHPVQLSAHLSGAMLLEANAKLERVG